MVEDPFVQTAQKAAEEVLAYPLTIEKGTSLLYRATVNNQLELTVDPKNPIRGQSAFQTDLCVLEEKENVDGVFQIPRVVMEFKKKISTHDVITYSAKANKHKQVYPYLRYGLVVGDIKTIPGRFFTHNNSLDFCIAASSFRKNRLHEIFLNLLKNEVATSRLLEDIAFGKTHVNVWRNEIIMEKSNGTVT